MHSWYPVLDVKDDEELNKFAVKHCCILTCQEVQDFYGVIELCTCRKILSLLLLSIVFS